MNAGLASLGFSSPWLGDDVLGPVLLDQPLELAPERPLAALHRRPELGLGNGGGVGARHLEEEADEIPLDDSNSNPI